MTQHIVKAFQEELDQLEALMAHMGGLAESQLLGAMEALKTNDSALAQKIISQDRLLDEREHEANSRALQILALRQPMAEDLRETVAAVKIATDLERIGDLARNIARRVLHGDLSSLGRIETGGVIAMGHRALSQIKGARDAYSARDLAMALEVWRADQELDRMHNSVLRETLTYMLEKPDLMTICMHLLFVAKMIERAGDHSTNIAETIVFLITGEPLVEDRPKESSVQT